MKADGIMGTDMKLDTHRSPTTKPNWSTVSSLDQPPEPDELPSNMREITSVATVRFTWARVGVVLFMWGCTFGLHGCASLPHWLLDLFFVFAFFPAFSGMLAHWVSKDTQGCHGCHFSLSPRWRYQLSSDTWLNNELVRPHLEKKTGMGRTGTWSNLIQFFCPYLV